MLINEGNYVFCLKETVGIDTRYCRLLRHNMGKRSSLYQVGFRENLFPVGATKAHSKTSGIAPPILNVGIRRRPL